MEERQEGGSQKEVKGKGSKTKGFKKPEATRPKTDNNSATDSYRDEIPQFAINNSEIEIPKLSLERSEKSEIKPPTANSKLPTEPMEVHHHPQIEKKGLKEYLLEGLMIFMAVTLGFYAESYREYLGDRTKETEFMKSMVSDLKADSGIVSGEIVNWQSAGLNSDTVLTILRSGNTPGNIRWLYRSVGNNFFRFNLLKYNNHTVEELKSSGNFRLIQYTAITDSIMKYDNDVQYYIGQEKGLENMMFAFKASELKVLDYKYFNREPYLKNFTIKVISNSPVLLTNDKLLLGEYYNNLFSYSMLASLHVKLLKGLKSEAVRLSAMINKQYSLNNE